MPPRRACLLAFVAGLTMLAAASTHGQPAYKLIVQPELKPQATIQLADAKVRRSPVKDDPGFRLQYHFKKDGKTLATLEARADDAVAVPLKEPGVCTVVLELFYPTFKTGNAPKGEFKAISNVLTLKVEAGEPAKVTVVEK